MKRLETIKDRLIWAHIVATGRIRLMREEGQGTTEYAILVGVLAVVAMLAIAAFRGRISELWDAITSGVNGL